MKPDRTLLKAADLIDQYGLAKGVLKDKNGCLCAVGALRQVVYGRVNIPQAVWRQDTSKDKKYMNAMDTLFRYLYLKDEPTIVEWNDSSDKATVVAGLRAAARKVVSPGDLVIRDAHGGLVSKDVFI